MQKLEEKVEDEDSLLRMQDKPNMSLLTQQPAQAQHEEGT